MAQWNKNTVQKCNDKTCSDEVLVTVERFVEGFAGVLNANSLRIKMMMTKQGG